MKRPFITKAWLLWIIIPLVCNLGCGNSNSRLMAKLRSGDLQVRRQAIRTVNVNPRFTDEIVDAICESSWADDLELRTLAINALAKVAGESQAAVDALIAALEDHDEAIRFAAASALLKNDPSLLEPRNVILSEIDKVNPRAMLLVAELKSNASWSIAALQDQVNHPEKSVRILAQKALNSVTSE